MPEWFFPTAFSSWKPFDGSEEDQAVQRVLRSGQLTMGPECAALEREFAAWNSNRHAITTNSGTAALHMAVAACGCGAGDEVITSTFSFVASANTILYVGAKPVFVRYSGTGEAVMASLRGDLDALSLSWSSGMRQVSTSENKMIPLLVSSKVPGLNVPSGKELGITVDELVMDHPHTMAGPPGMPSDVRRLWEETFAKVIKDPEWIAKMDKLGYPASPLIGKEKLDASIAATMGRMDKYKDIISGLTLIK